jgi:hypothetical protein
VARQVHLEHAVPGRARLRVPAPRTPQEVRELGKRVAALEPVRSVEVNPTTGSILLHLRPQDPVDALLEDIRALGYLVDRVTRPRAKKPPARAPKVPHTRGSKEVRNVLATMNARVHEATGGRADLRVIVPATLGALALRQMLKDAKSLGQAPWYVLVYYAFDSFYKMNDELTEEDLRR